MFFLRKIAYGLLFTLIITGCSHVVETNFAPEFTNKKFSKVYIQKGENDNKFHVYREIKDELELLGYEVGVGTEKTPAYPVDLILTYQDRWYWDMTMYLLELNIQVVDPDGYVSLADTKVRRTSLIRKNRKEMVREVFSELFVEPEDRPSYMMKSVRVARPLSISSLHLHVTNESKEHTDTIKAFYDQSDIAFTSSKLKYPKKDVHYIASVYRLRGKSYLQIRERDTERLAAEAIIAIVPDAVENDEGAGNAKRLRGALAELQQALAGK